jgi:hypothetical protein
MGVGMPQINMRDTINSCDLAVRYITVLVDQVYTQGCFLVMLLGLAEFKVCHRVDDMKSKKMGREFRNSSRWQLAAVVLF